MMDILSTVQSAAAYAVLVVVAVEAVHIRALNTKFDREIGEPGRGSA